MAQNNSKTMRAMVLRGAGQKLHLERREIPRPGPAEVLIRVADFMLADSRYCFPLDASVPAAVTTPLLCAGLIGFRSLRMAGDASRIGMYGFGGRLR